jgi:hypothetical protein
MIVYWCKDKKNSQNKFLQNKKEDTKTIIYPYLDLDESSNSNSFDLNELNNSSNSIQNELSFFEENSFSEIYNENNEIENNNLSDTRSFSNEENKERFENLIINMLSIPLNNENQFDEKKIQIEIENLFSGNYLINEQKILNLFNLCKENQYLKEFFFQKILFNLVNLLNNNKNIYETFFMILSENQREIFINEIIKNTPLLIINENGHEVLLFLISFKNLNIINNIIYFISQNFIFYCLNDYSSKVIYELLSKGFLSLNYNIINQIKENFKESK